MALAAIQKSPLLQSRITFAAIWLPCSSGIDRKTVTIRGAKMALPPVSARTIP